MRKKLMTLLLSMSLFGTLGGCSITTDISGVSNDDVQASSESKENTTEDSKTIGILMPTKSSERWINDGNDMV